VVLGRHVCEVLLLLLLLLEHSEDMGVLESASGGWDAWRSSCGRGHCRTVDNTRGNEIILGHDTVATDVTSIPGGIHTIIVIVISLTGIVTGNTDDDFEFTIEDHGEAVTTDGLLNARDARTFTPLVEFAAKSISLELEKTKLARCKDAVPS
jgi:hypothetical protein